MTQAYTTSNITNLLTFPFNDPKWAQKLLIGSLVAMSAFIIPILPHVLIYGYAHKIIQRVVHGDGQPYLPEWDDWGSLLQPGFRILGALSLVFLPMILIMFMGMSLFMVPSLMMEFDGGGDLETLLPFFIFGGMALFILSIIISLPLGLLAHFLLVHVSAKGEWSAALRPREWWPILRAGLPGFALTYLLIIGLSVIFSFSMQILMWTMVFCIFLPFLSAIFSFYIPLITAAFGGRAYRDGIETLRQPVPPPTGEAASQI